MAPAHIITKVSSTGRNSCDNQRERIVKKAAERTAPNKASRPRVWPEEESLPPPMTIKTTPRTEVKIEATCRGLGISFKNMAASKVTKTGIKAIINPASEAVVRLMPVVSRIK